MAYSIMAMYEAHILPQQMSMKRGVIHGDMNGQNIIVCRVEEEYEIVGLIDFGDCVHSCYLFELATLLSYIMMNRENPVAFVAPVIQGYLDAFPLSHKELLCLFYAVLALLCTSAVKGEYNASLDPENEHIQRDISHAWHLVSLLLSMSKTDVDILWRICD